MTGAISANHGGARISACVKWYDPEKGYGFLEPDDSAPDIVCRAPALAAVGLEILLAGATVDCETMPGGRGPEVARISYAESRLCRFETPEDLLRACERRVPPIIARDGR